MYTDNQSQNSQTWKTSLIMAFMKFLSAILKASPVVSGCTRLSRLCRSYTSAGIFGHFCRNDNGFGGYRLWAGDSGSDAWPKIHMYQNQGRSGRSNRKRCTTRGVWQHLFKGFSKTRNYSNFLIPLFKEKLWEEEPGKKPSSNSWLLLLGCNSKDFPIHEWKFLIISSLKIVESLERRDQRSKTRQRDEKSMVIIFCKLQFLSKCAYYLCRVMGTSTSCPFPLLLHWSNHLRYGFVYKPWSTERYHPKHDSRPVYYRRGWATENIRTYKVKEPLVAI